MLWLSHQRKAPSLFLLRLYRAHAVSLLILGSTNSGEQAATGWQPRVLRKAGLLLAGMLDNPLAMVGETWLGGDFWIHDLSELKHPNGCESFPSSNG